MRFLEFLHIPLGLFSIQWEKGIPRLRMPDRLQTPVTWVVRCLTILGIGLSAVEFHDWRLAVAVSAALVGVQQFLERTIFEFVLMYFQPMPNFALAPKLWVGMGYAFPSTPQLLDAFGPVIDSDEYARNLFDLLRAWNYGSNDDKDNNICVSLIFENSSRYTVYIYPNRERHTAVEFFEKARIQYQKHFPGKEPKELVVQANLVSGFDFGAKSPVQIFASNYTQSRPVWFQAFEPDGTGGINIRFGMKPILKHHVKIKNRSALTARDFEFALGRQGNTPRIPRSRSK